jgi:hypothetical protein
LRVFNAVEGQEEAGGGNRAGRLEEVLKGEDFLGTDHGDYTLVALRFGHHRQLLAGFLADADAGLTTKIDQPLKAVVQTLAGYQDVVETALAGLEGFFDRVKAIQNFHKGQCRRSAEQD